MAAFSLIAEKGFEGLRVRDVAAHVGLNGATLHYYFPTKEDLIHAVAAHTIERLRSVVAGEQTTHGDPRDELRDHLARVYALMKAEPELFTVLVEVTIRARRTPADRFLVEQNKHWHDMLQRMLQMGVDNGSWPVAMDTDAMAWAIMTLMEGVSLHAAEASDRAEEVMTEMFKWVAAR